MRGKRTPDDVRAKVLALLFTGSSVEEAAETHGLERTTVYRWLDTDAEFQQVAIAKRREIAERETNIGELAAGYLRALLTGLKRQVEIVSTEEYLSKQSAADVAVLHGVMADKGFRLLSAAAAATDTGQRVAASITGGDIIESNPA